MLCIVAKKFSPKRSESSFFGEFSLLFLFGSGSRNILHREFVLSDQGLRLLNGNAFRTLTGISIFCLARRDSAWVTRVFGQFCFFFFFFLKKKKYVADRYLKRRGCG
jgi:hypothetical protein